MNVLQVLIIYLLFTTYNTGQQRKHRFQQFSCCVCILYIGKVFKEPLPINVVREHADRKAARLSRKPPFIYISSFRNKKNIGVTEREKEKESQYHMI
jgi:hypothetical protein